MKEIDTTPICPNCGKIEVPNAWAYCHPSLVYKEELLKGCPICWHPLVVGFEEQHCCSNPKCPGWKVHKNGEVRYAGKLIFYASHADRRIVAMNGRGTQFPKMNHYYLKLFNKIMKEQCISNVHKGLPMCTV